MLDPICGPCRNEFYVPQGRYPVGQQQMQQGNQALAVRMQETKITGAPKALRQHMLEHQPEKVGAGNGALFHPSGLGVTIAERHLAVAAGDDILLADDAPIQITAEVDQRLSMIAVMEPPMIGVMEPVLGGKTGDFGGQELGDFTCFGRPDLVAASGCFGER